MQSKLVMVVVLEGKAMLAMQVIASVTLPTEERSPGAEEV